LTKLRRTKQSVPVFWTTLIFDDVVVPALDASNGMSSSATDLTVYA